MTEQEQLTPAEAQAVLDLWHLREQHRYEAGGYVSVNELADLLQCPPVEIRRMATQVRALRPATLTASPNRLSAVEAETVVSLHAESRASFLEPVTIAELAQRLNTTTPAIADVVATNRERTKELREAANTAQTPRSMVESYGVAVGENPHSWNIMWAVLGVCVLLVALGLLFGQP